MDITALFKACVKTARLKRKTLSDPDKATILKRDPLSSNGFAEKTTTICQQLTQLRDCLLENRSAYMKFGCHLKGVVQKMTDSERDLIDSETDKILTICTQLIIELRKDVKSHRTSRQNAEYMDNVLESLTTYLKNVFGISNQMRTYRVKKELEQYRMLKLKADKRDIPETPKMAKKKGDSMSPMESNGLRRRRGHKARHSVNENEEDLINDWAELHNHHSKSSGGEEETRRREDNDDNYDSGTDTGDLIADRSTTLESSTTRRSIPSKLALDEEISADQSSYIQEEEEAAAQHELSPEDIQMFELENKQLLSELKGLSEEVAQIEKNVTEIAKLQDLFTEKVTLQKSDIDRIANTVVGVTENVKDANDQIREAIQRNAGLRVYILFFLLVMSFSLLFLHWYND